MKRNISIRILGLLSAVSLSVAASAHATTVGLTPNTSKGYAIWDTFPSAAFAGRAPDSSGVFTALSLDVTSNGPFLTGAGDRIYLNGGTSSWTARGNASTAPKTFSLQLKNYQYTSQSLTTYFTATLSFGGVALTPDSSTTRIVTEGANNDEILTWTWNTSLANNAGTNFTVNFGNSAGANISIDGLSASIGVVPEPSTCAALTAGGAALLVTLKRRRRALA